MAWHRGSSCRANKIGDSGQPCLTERPIPMELPLSPLTKSLVDMFLWHSATQSHMVSPSPHPLNTAWRKQWDTVERLAEIELKDGQGVVPFTCCLPDYAHCV